MAIVDPWDSPRPPSRDDAPEVRAPAGVIDPWDAVPATRAESAPVSGGNLRSLARSPGLAARYLIEGVGALPAMITQPFATAGDWAFDKAGAPQQYRFGNQAQVFSRIADAARLPSPEDAGERVVGDASRILSSAMTGAGLAGKAAQGVTGASKSVLERLAANLPGQAATAVGAGLAGGATREAGGGPIEQFVASLLGGVAGGVAQHYSDKAIKSGMAAAKALLQPRDIAGKIEFELQRAGVDWNALSTEAKIQLTRDAEKAVKLGRDLSPDALRRLADYRNIGATPMTGDITQNPRLITEQRNLAKVQANAPSIGGPDLPMIQNENAKRVIGALSGIEGAADDAYSAGAKIQGVIVGKDRALKSASDALYQSARDSQGRALPLDATDFVVRAYSKVAEMNRGPFIPEAVRSILETLRNGTLPDGTPAPFTVDTIDSIKSILAGEVAKAQRAGDGNAVMAVRAIREALDDVKPNMVQTGSQMPVTGATAAAMRTPEDALRAFDAARASHRARMVWQESAPAIQDALEGTDPVKFVQRHITGGELKDVATLAKEIRGTPEAFAAARKQIVQYIMDRGRADGDVTRFGSAGLESGMRAIGDRKLSLFFNPQEIQRMKSAVNVAKYMQAQPIGSAVNNSNSGVYMFAKAVEHVLRGTPGIGPLLVNPVLDQVKGARASIALRQASNVGNALAVPLPRQPAPINALFPLAAMPSRENDRRK